jgi:hypothetical protein
MLAIGALSIRGFSCEWPVIARSVFTAIGRARIRGAKRQGAARERDTSNIRHSAHVSPESAFDPTVNDGHDQPQSRVGSGLRDKWRRRCHCRPPISGCRPYREPPGRDEPSTGSAARGHRHLADNLPAAHRDVTVHHIRHHADVVGHHAHDIADARACAAAGRQIEDAVLLGQRGDARLGVFTRFVWLPGRSGALGIGGDRGRELSSESW